MPLREAILKQMTSKASSLIPVNEFQREEFKKHNILKRDPMVRKAFENLQSNQIRKKNIVL